MMRKRRFEQYLERELSVLGDRFNELYPKFSWKNRVIDIEELGKQFVNELGLLFGTEKGKSSEWSSQAIRLATILLMMAFQFHMKPIDELQERREQTQ